jgi:hypothetical protein
MVRLVGRAFLGRLAARALAAVLLAVLRRRTPPSSVNVAVGVTGLLGSAIVAGLASRWILFGKGPGRGWAEALIFNALLERFA